AKVAHTRPDFLNHAGQFVTKQRRRHDHARVIAALKDLEIGAAGQSHVHLHQHFPALQRGDGHFLNLHVLLAVEDRRCHLSFHSAFSPSIPGWITTFNESGPGCEASRKASTACPRGKRCVINRAKSIPPPNTNSTPSSCISTEALYDPSKVFSSRQTAE